jgi:hypothetical protein
VSVTGAADAWVRLVVSLALVADAVVTGIKENAVVETHAMARAWKAAMATSDSACEGPTKLKTRAKGAMANSGRMTVGLTEDLCSFYVVNSV